MSSINEIQAYNQEYQELEHFAKVNRLQTQTHQVSLAYLRDCQSHLGAIEYMRRQRSAGLHFEVPDRTSKSAFEVMNAWDQNCINQSVVDSDVVKAHQQWHKNRHQQIEVFNKGIKDIDNYEKEQAEIKAQYNALSQEGKDRIKQYREREFHRQHLVGFDNANDLSPYKSYESIGELIKERRSYGPQ